MKIPLPSNLVNKRWETIYLDIAYLYFNRHQDNPNKEHHHRLLMLLQHHHHRLLMLLQHHHHRLLMLLQHHHPPPPLIELPRSITLIFTPNNDATDHTCPL
jgi:hypothetical protein